MPQYANQDSADRMPSLAGIRIARISTVPFFITTQLEHQIRELAQAGAEVHVVTSPGVGCETIRSWPNVRLTEIPIKRSISPLHDLVTIASLYQFLRRNQIQIAHSTTPKAGLVVAIAAFLARVPVRLHTFTGQPWLALSGILRKLSRASDQLICKLNTHCFADSPSQVEFLVGQGITGPNHLSTVGSGSLAGVDLQRFSTNRFSDAERSALKRAFSIRDTSFIALFIGRLTTDKGIRELLDAFKGSQYLAEQDAHLMLVGEPDTDSGTTGDAISPELEQSQRIHFVGYSSSPESFLSVADVLCLPSYREGFGTVIIEAAAMGVPAIGSDIYGLSDAIERNKTGLLVPAQDSNRLRAALEELARNSSLRREMGTNALARAMQHFDARVISKELATLYTRFLEEALQ